MNLTRPPIAVCRENVPGMPSYGEWLHRRGLGVRTIDARLRFYRERLESWGTWDLPLERIAMWLSRYDGWTRLTYYSHLVSIYDWQVHIGAWPTNPVREIRKPPRPKAKPSPLTDDELRAALLKADDRTRAFLMLGYLAGLRAFEVAKFHGRDIDATSLNVLGKGGQHATLPTHPTLWALAQTYPRDDYWFPSPQAGRSHIAVGTVTHQVGALFRGLGIRGASHRARHSYGTTLLRGGANLRVVQELMRHSSLATTAAYLAVDEDERRQAMLALVA